MTKNDLKLITEKTSKFLDDLFKVFEKHNLCIFSEDGGVQIEPFDEIFKKIYREKNYFDGDRFEEYKKKINEQTDCKDVHISNVCGDDVRIHNILKTIK